MNLKEETLIREYQFRGRIINLRTDTVKLPNGAEAGREVVEHPGGVCVAPLPVPVNCCSFGSIAIRMRKWCWNYPPASATAKTRNR